jgi:heme-degrading monooxygenase HmoA
MYLRLVQAKTKLEEVANLKVLYSNTIIPTLQGTPGCLYACLMQNSKTPEDMVSMTLWESQEDAEAYVKGGLFEHLMKPVRPMLSDSSEWRVQLSKEMKLEYSPSQQEPAISTYPVTLDLPTKQMDGSRPKSMFLRLVSVNLKPNMKDEYHRLYVNEIIPALLETQGCLHAYLIMPSRGDNQSISMTVWDSREDAAAYEKSGQFAALVDKVKHTFTDLYQWKMELDKGKQSRSVTTEDLKVEGYTVVTMKNFQ